MKKHIIIAIAILITLNACEEHIDYRVKGKITLANYFQTEDDAIQSVTSIYDALGEVDLYNSSFWLLQDLASDDCDALPTWNDPNAHQIDGYNIQADNNYISNIWKASYRLIARANLSIDSIPVIDMDPDLQNRLLGEAKFLRALSYFNLVRLYGDVPLILKTESDIDNYLVPRENVDIVYDQIIGDLEFAVTVLPDSYATEKGRATRGAALGLLAKIYLTLEEWSLAVDYAEDVMDMEPLYGLYDDYADNFKEVNENGKESVFEVQFYAGSQPENTRIVISGLPSLTFIWPAAVGIILPTEDLTGSFETGDHRYEVTFFEEYFYFGNNTFDPHIWKYWDQDAYEADETGESGANFPVMRYSEILLIHAEALNELNNGPTTEAYSSINRIRERARNGNTEVLPDLAGLSYAEFQEAVLKEKRCETVNEGQRWFDLARTGTLVEYITRAKGDKASPTADNYLFPIPQRERDLNKELTQNTGY